MNLKPIKIIPLKSLNIESLEDIVLDAFENTFFNEDLIVSVGKEIAKDELGYYIRIENTLMDKTKELSVEEKINYMINNPGKYNIFITLVNEKYVEFYDINSVMEDYDLTLEDFKVKEGTTEDELKRYESIEDEEKKSEVFYDYYEYRGFCEDIYNKTFYADDDWVDFGDARDRMLGLILHLNENSEIEIYGSSWEQWDIYGGGFTLIENLGSFKDTALKLINDIVN